MKKNFMEPELEICTFDVVDVIATSGDSLDEDELPPIVVG